MSKYKTLAQKEKLLEFRDNHKDICIRTLQQRRFAQYHTKWQRLNRHSLPIDGLPEIICSGCGISFKPNNSRQKYCVKQCGVNWRSIHLYKHKYGVKEASTLRGHLRRLKTKANRDRDLSLDFLLSLYEKQKGLCAISGLPMTHISGQGKQAFNISIDRIDSSRNYEEDNVQLVCCALNIMKSDFIEQDFIKICKAVAEHNKD